MTCYEFEGIRPVVDPTAYVHPTAVLIGDVIIGPRCLIGPGASLRGDIGRLIIKEGANIQDNCVLHCFPGKDVTVEEDDVHGDGVNVASRLESIADPGGIYISESIEKAIQGQTDVQAKYLGEVKLKNVAYGVRTYALQGVGLPVPRTPRVKGNR